MRNGSALTTGIQHNLVPGCYEMKSLHHDLSFAFRLTSSDKMKEVWFARCVADGISSFTPKWRSAPFMAGLTRALNAMPAEGHPLVTNYACPEISLGDRVLP